MQICIFWAPQQKKGKHIVGVHQHGTHVVWKLHSFSFVGNKKNDYEHVGMPGGSWRMRVMRLGSISLATRKGTVRLVTGYVGKDPTTLR